LSVLKRHLPILVNGLFCGVIGFVLGLVSQSILSWTCGAISVGALLGWLLEGLLGRLGVTGRRVLRATLLVLLLEALIVIYVLVPAIGAYHTVFPVRQPISTTPQALQLDYVDVNLVAADGVKIAGWYLPSRNGAAVIAVHGMDATRLHVMPHVLPLIEQGYGALLIDMRAHGRSGGDRYPGPYTARLDVLAALAYVLEETEVDPEKVGALGLSAGASAVIQAAAEREEIAAIFVDGTGMSRTADALRPLLPELRPLFFMTPLNWMYHQTIQALSGHPLGPAIKTLVPQISPRPIYFVAAEGDQTEAALARRYHALAGEYAQLWIVPGVGHLGGVAEYPQEYRQRLLDFFNAELLE
jgi:pimeloyl-ACP methyl ester carboxylesterase